MIIYRTGNILNERADVLVCPVHGARNMNSGLAKEFKRKFPSLYSEYWIACKMHHIYPGQLCCTLEGSKKRKFYVVALCTRYSYYHRSNIKDIEEGLDNLVKFIKSDKRIRSVAIPAIGCGGGRLKWDDVSPVIVDKMRELSESIDVIIFEPTPRK